MIVDEFLRAHPHCTSLLSATQIIEVPLEMYPCIDSSGGWGPDWKEIELERILRRGCKDEKGNSVIYAEVLRPPFSKICLFRPGENSFTLIHSPSAKSIEWPSDFSFDVWTIFSVGSKAACMCGGSCFALPRDGRLVVGSTFKALDLTRAHTFLMNSFIGDVFMPGDSSDYPRDQTNVLVSSCSALTLLNCRNISMREVRPSRQMRRASIRKGDAPLFSWHVLELNRPRGASNSNQGSGEPMSLHWTRGHFKDYSENGLFGKVHGVYWWSPQMHGKADRISAHTYKLTRVKA
jgi:hypothetical protein